MNPLSLEVPAHRPIDIAGPQLGQHFSLFGVELAAVLAEGVHDARVPGHQGAQGSARPDRAELAVVADQHELGAGGFDVGGQAEQVGIVSETHLVQDDHVPLGELELMVVEAPGQAGQGARLGYPRLFAQRARCLAGGGGAEHLVAPMFKGVCYDPQHRGLARASHALDKLRPSPRRADSLGGGALAFAERPAQLLFRAACGLRHLAPADCSRVAAGQLAPEALGYGPFVGKHAGERVTRSLAPATPMTGTASGSAKARSANGSKNFVSCP